MEPAADVDPCLAGTMIAASATPNRIIAPKVTRQPVKRSMTPPRTGAAAGTTPMIVPMRDNSLPARGPS